jgi:hypothetical protein
VIPPEMKSSELEIYAEAKNSGKLVNRLKTFFV